MGDGKASNATHISYHGLPFQALNQHLSSMACAEFAAHGSDVGIGPIRVEACVRKWFCQTVRQQIVLTGITRNESSVRERQLFWTIVAMTDFYTYPEHTPTTHP